MYNIEIIKKAISKNRILNKIIIFGTIDSTNNYLKERNFATGTVVTAEVQEAGKGRHGKKWVSGKGGLWFSFVINEKVKDPYHYVVLSSVAVLDTLKKYKIKAEIKWPNDILIKGKKVCGILIENDAYEGKLVCGVGINIGNALPAKSDIPATSLNKQLKRKVDIEKLFVELLKEIDKNLKAKKSVLMKKWVKNQVDLTGKTIQILKNSKIQKFVVEKINKNGTIKVIDSKGKKQVLKGEVFFIS